MGVVLSLAFASLVAVGPARAQELRFTYSGGVEATFTLDSNPVPTFVVDNAQLSKAIFDVPVSVGGQTYANGAFVVYPTVDGGGISLATNAFATAANPLVFYDAETSGDQVYAGTVEAPVFVPGTYHFDYTDYFDAYRKPASISSGFGTLIISSVPLPASAPLFGVALVALGAVGYGLKRKKAAAAA